MKTDRWLHGVKDAVQHMTTIDELNQAEAMLTAVVRRLKQLDKDASEAERVRIFAFRQIGELLGPAKPGNPRPSGANQYTGPELMSQPCDISSGPSGVARNRDYQCRTIKQHWDAVEPLLAKMKKPSPKAVMRRSLAESASEPSTQRTYTTKHGTPYP